MRWAAPLALALAALQGCGGSGVPGDGGPADGSPPDAEPDGDAPEPDAARSDAEDEPDGELEPETPCAPTSLAERFRGDLVVGREPVHEVVGPCGLELYHLVAAAGSRVELELEPEGLFPLLLSVVYPDAPYSDERIAVGRAAPGSAPAVVELEPPRSGELAILVRSEVPEVAQGYRLAARCVSGCDLETTRFPVVLVHGWTGFASIGPIDYFYNVPPTLAARGYKVFVASLDPYNSVEVRSEQLAEQLDRFLEAARARKVSLIAHSQGGLDSRRAVSTLGYGDRVASLVTVSTPHRGTPITDIALGLLPGESGAALYFLLELLGATAVGAESDAEASFYSLSEQYVREVFNPATPDDPRVEYVSYAGRTCLYGITCDDVCDIEIRWSYDLIYLAAGPNDGMVPVSSAPWGEYRGEIPADHFDEIGQLFGITGPAFDHEAFYLGLARDLAAEGH